MQGLIVIGALLVVASAIFAHLGYKGREQVVGIDLGTTFSVVAVRQRYRNGSSTVTVLPDRLSGKPLVPSVVAFLPLEEGGTLVGDKAVEVRSKYPKSTVFNAKRFIGRSMEEVEGDAAAFPYEVAGFNDSAGFRVPAVTTFFKKPEEQAEPRWVSPITVGAEIVKHLKRSISAYMGYDMSRAVICVPAKFGQKETKATVEAFEQAGMKVMRVLDEPTAAAVAYGLNKKSGSRHVLVYDIGGGTLDASLLYINGKSVSVLGVAGDDHLGGSDFDRSTRKLLQDRLPTSAKAAEMPSGKVHKCDDVGLLIVGEQAKIELSSKDSIVVHCLDADGSAREMHITRDDFEQTSADLFARALEPVDKVLSDQMMAPKDVKDVVLVGGASRTPKLRAMLQEYFGPDHRLHTEIDPDVTVAYGAANIVD